MTLEALRQQLAQLADIQAALDALKLDIQGQAKQLQTQNTYQGNADDYFRPPKSRNEQTGRPFISHRPR